MSQASIVNVCFGLVIGMIGYHIVGGKHLSAPIIDLSHHSNHSSSHLVSATSSLVTTPILYVCLGFSSCLLVASLLTVMYRLQTSRWPDDMTPRVLLWWLLAGLFVASLYFGRRGVILLWMLCSFLSLKQFLSSLSMRRTDREVLLWVYASVPVQYGLVAWLWPGLFAIFVPVFMGLLVPFRMELQGETKGFLRACGTLQWGLLSCVYSLSHLAYLTAFQRGPQSAAGPAGLLVYVVLLTEANDIVAWLWTAAGLPIRARVAPYSELRWGGALAGLIVTVLLGSYTAPLLTPMHDAHATGSALLIAVAGHVGTITLACVRVDSGRSYPLALLPTPDGFGLLDRLASLVYTAPLFFHYVRYFFKYV